MQFISGLSHLPAVQRSSSAHAPLGLRKIELIIPETSEDAVVASLVLPLLASYHPNFVPQLHHYDTHFDWGLDGRAFTDCSAIAAEMSYLPCSSD